MQNNDFFKTILSILKAFGKSDAIKIDNSLTNNNFFEFGHNLVDENRIILPKADNLNEARAASDMALCYMMFSDKKIHDQLKSDFNLNDKEAKIFDEFEKIRLIGLVKNEYSGVAKNIVEKIEEDVVFEQENQVFAMVFLKEVIEDDSENFDIKKIAEFLKYKNIDQNIVLKIRTIAKKLDNQELFAQNVRDFLEFLNKQEEENNQEQKENKSKKSQSSQSENENSQNQENIDEKPFEEANNKKEKENKNVKQNEKIDEIKNDKGGQIQSQSRSDDEAQEEKIEFKKIYKVFTNKFDEIILPQKLVDKNELEVLRYGLELRIERLEAISKKLTIKLKKKLLAKKNIAIEQSESEGILDRKKLSQIVLNPLEESFFVKQKNHEYRDIVVTILLDNSGSMRGSPIVMSAMACEIIASILEKFAVKTEILGFTTADWKGGKARKIWEVQGRTPNPGRLNDLRHIIYKSANQNFKKAKVNLGLMLKEGILKENIDGEALLWARSRLIQRSEKRKILMIISDGTPVDDSTNSSNDSEILVDHLHRVIKKIEKDGKIEIVGIGIGHNVGAFYRNSISIKNSQELGEVMIEKIVDLI